MLSVEVATRQNLSAGWSALHILLMPPVLQSALCDCARDSNLAQPMWPHMVCMAGSVQLISVCSDCQINKFEAQTCAVKPVGLIM